MRSHAGIGKIAQKMNKRVHVTGKRSDLLRGLRLKFRSVRRKLRVWNAGVPVMHAMVRLVKESE